VMADRQSAPAGSTMARSGVALRLLLILLPAGLLLAGCGSEVKRDGAPPPAAEYPYVASSIRDPYHRRSCQWAARIEPVHAEYYRSRRAAERAGHRPCRICRP